jgi:large subunit ribosomal protein L15
MEIHELKPTKGSITRKHRVGRGHGSGSVKTSGRGGKGQTARSGGGKGPGFEGGQTPWYRRLPKLKGFKNARFKKTFQIVSLQKLDFFQEGTLIEPDLLFKNRLIRKQGDPVKILGNGEITKVLTVKAHAFSKTAQEKISSRGGKAELIQ